MLEFGKFGIDKNRLKTIEIIDAKNEIIVSN